MAQVGKDSSSSSSARSLTVFDNWPLPSYQGRPPVISSGFGMRGKRGKERMHSGADIDYRAVAGDPPYTGKYTAARSPNYYGPAGVAVIAAAAGKVIKARMETKARGVVEVLLAGKPVTLTIYRHMSTLAVSKGDTVRSGQRLGIMGGSQNHPFRHLHFSVRYAGKLVAPGPMLARSGVMILTPAETLPPKSFETPTKPGKPGKLVARKASTGWLILLALLALAKSKSR